MGKGGRVPSTPETMRARLRRFVVSIGVVSIGVVVLGVGPSIAFVGSGSSAAADDGARIVCRWSDPRLDEVSGIALSAVHTGIAWVHNDSGGGPYLYALDTSTCAVRARVRISNIGACDIEGIASGVDARGRHVLWVGDVGDNRDSWPSVRIHAVVEPASLRDQSVTAQTYRFTYRDGPLNAETVLAMPAAPRLWVVTKQLAQGGIYPLPEPPSTATVSKLSRISTTYGLVTDGAISPSGTKYVLRDYLWAYVFDGVPPGRQITRITLPVQPQGEAITWTADGRALLAAGERDSALWYVPLPTDARDSNTPTSSPGPTASGGDADPRPTSGSATWPVALIAGGAVLVVILVATRWLRR